jgi:hypothetical protein
MNSVFESIFFLAITLLGVDITIFVLSVTLLSKANQVFNCSKGNNGRTSSKSRRR